jgi:2-C-methyl-D-erythritol 2,4-cyclodiphosphate synthase
MGSKIRIGIGYDVHPLARGRKLILGGVEIAFDRGLSGWSDADALTHAIIDALLGAAALGDIGRHFPSGKPEYKNISSLSLLKTTRDKLAASGFKIVNVDATIIAEKPRLIDFIDRMRQQLSQTLAIKLEQVSVKASTANGLGSAGQGEGIGAIAVALLEGGQDEGI